MLAGWKESHNSGATVTFWLADSALLDTFRAMTVKKGNTAGQRLAMVLVEIGDDELPITQPEAPKEKIGPLCLLACQWCQDEKFQEWARNHPGACGYIAKDSEEDKAKRFIYQQCGIKSRRELDAPYNPEAAEKFHRLIRIPFSKYLEGK